MWLTILICVCLASIKRQPRPEGFEVKSYTSNQCVAKSSQHCLQGKSVSLFTGTLQEESLTKKYAFPFVFLCLPPLAQRQPNLSYNRKSYLAFILTPAYTQHSQNTEVSTSVLS